MTGNSVNIGLVLLAAGFGSRFGGKKQLSVIGPDDSIIMDYTIFDAWRIGYSWITIILREEMVEQFDREVGRRWADRIQLNYSIQDTHSHIPQELLQEPQVARRKKPWGTGHALLCAAEQIYGPFTVANADDFYGYHGLKEIFYYLRNTVLSEQSIHVPLPQAMVGFQLGRTLSENGPVSRGICHSYFDEQGCEWLDNIQEHTNLFRGEDLQIYSIQDQDTLTLPEQTPVSMNLFGLQPGVFAHLQQQFTEFLQYLGGPEQALKKEFYLPAVVERMLECRQATVAMLHSLDPWFGLTYLEDTQVVGRSIRDLIANKQYPANLFAPIEA